MSGENEAHKNVAHTTVLSSLLDSDLPPREKAVTRLEQESVGILGGGIETTRAALSLATFHVLDSSAILHRLKKELEIAMPDVAKPASLTELEKLPFLTAVILEGKLDHRSLNFPVPISSQRV